MGIIFILPLIYFNDTVIYADAPFYFFVSHAKLRVCPIRLSQIKGIFTRVLCVHFTLSISRCYYHIFQPVTAGVATPSIYESLDFAEEEGIAGVCVGTPVGHG